MKRSDEKVRSNHNEDFGQFNPIFTIDSLKIVVMHLIIQGRFALIKK